MYQGHVRRLKFRMGFKRSLIFYLHAFIPLIHVAFEEDNSKSQGIDKRECPGAELPE